MNIAIENIVLVICATYIIKIHRSLNEKNGKLLIYNTS